MTFAAETRTYATNVAMNDPFLVQILEPRGNFEDLGDNLVNYDITSMGQHTYPTIHRNWFTGSDQRANAIGDVPIFHPVSNSTINPWSALHIDTEKLMHERM